MPTSFGPKYDFDDLLGGKCNIRETIYCGRFAPSSSGSLHLGNLRTALISWLRSRLSGGKWLLRIDDLDTPRNRIGSITSIQEDLIWLGLTWDGPLILQSERIDIYKQALLYLKDKGKLFPCRCSRRELTKSNPYRYKKLIYPGTCRNLDLPWGASNGRLPSLRLNVSEEFQSICGDIILRRSDGFIAYHLANVVDDITLGINEVVRGEDLRPSMIAHLAVMKELNQVPISYRHVPIMYETNGKKISKREGGIGLDSLKLKGLTPPDVIGLLASSINLSPLNYSISADDLLDKLSYDRDLICKAFID